MNGEKLLLELPAWPSHATVFDRYGLDSQAIPQEDLCLFTKDGHPVISRQDLHLVAARPKAGKTSFAWALAEAAIKGEALGFKAVEEGLRVLICDSEMAEPDLARKCRSFEESTNSIVQNQPTDRLRVLKLRRPDKDDGDAAKVAPSEWRMRLLKEALAEEPFDLIVVDGAHDWCRDVMDNQRAIECSRELMSLAEEYDAAILCIIHLNPKGSGETRGHLGSQLQRDCADYFKLSRCTDGTGNEYIEAAHQIESRHAQATPTAFKFGESGEAITFVPISRVQTETDKLRDEFSALFQGSRELPTSELIAALKADGWAGRSAERTIQRAKDAGILTMVKRGVYTLSSYHDFKDFTSDEDDIL